MAVASESQKPGKAILGPGAIRLIIGLAVTVAISLTFMWLLGAEAFNTRFKSAPGLVDFGTVLGMGVLPFAQTLLYGVTTGSIYALIALGYTLVYGIIELINFAHGDLFMLGSMAALTVLEWTVLKPDRIPVPLWLGLLLALIVPMTFCATANVFIERVAYRRLRNAPRLAPLISAIGVSFILINVGLWWRGANPQSFPLLLNFFGSENLIANLLGPEIGRQVRFTYKDLSVIMVTVPLLLLLNFVVFRTRMGKAMRATAQDRDASALMGINVNRTIAFAFLLGGALAGAAGLIFGMYTGTTRYTYGFDAGLKAFTAAVLGGIGNLYGAALGGYMIGIVSAFSDRILNNTWTSATVFTILILILVFRPSGIMGEQTVEKV
jgi:branched-chain amino acid transport system permease protein